MKKTSSLIYLFLLFFTTVNITAQSSNPEIFIEIKEAFDAEDYEKIISKKSEIYDQIAPNPDTLAADLLYFLGDAYLAYDSLGKALEIMEKELEVRTNLPSSDPVLLADTHNNLGYYLYLNSEFTKAKSNFARSLALYKSNLGLENQYYITTTLDLAKTNRILGEYREAMRLYEDLLQLELVKKNYLHIINRELGLIYFDMGYYSKSEQILKKNLDFIGRNFGVESIEYATALVALATPYYYRSQYSESELLYTEALDIISKLSGAERLEEDTKNNLAVLYWKIGLHSEASTIFDEILGEEETVENAITFSNYAQNLSATDQQELSIKYFNKALKITKDLLGSESELYIRFLKEKALAFKKSESLNQYYNLMNKSYLASKKILEESNPEYSKYEFNWGLANFRLNNIEKAELHINTAHDLRSKYLSKKHPLNAETSKELAELSWLQDDLKKAKNRFKETFDNYFSQIDAYFPALSEQQKANFYTNTLRSTFEEFNSFAIAYHQKDPNLLGDMYNYQLATKGLIMYATAKARKNILNSDDNELIQKYQNWIGTKELISQSYSMSQKQAQGQNLKLDSLTKVSSELEKELSRASADFAEAYNSKKYTWKDVQGRLKDNEVAIEMIRFREFTPDSSGLFSSKINYAALLIDKKSKHPELILLENGQELENKYIKNYKNSIKFKLKDQYSYDYFWKPIAEHTRKYNKIYFSPDGIYNQISINALLNTTSKKYVLEEQNIQLVTNTKDLIAYSTERPNSNLASSPTLFGFPNYNKGIDQSEEDQNVSASKIVENASLNRGLRGNLQRYIKGNSLVTSLPGTKEEIEKIGAIYAKSQYSQPKTYFENEADERQLKNVDNPQVLHVATHGFFLEDNETSNLESEEKYSTNPLLKSGLIMAGANSFLTSGINKTNKQDGILTAYEAMNLDLKNTELVVLSACETGLGELKNGEGVYGLRRAFLVAGADAIIMSLWSVDDKATQELMTAFYQNWLGGQDKLTAFNEAQKQIKKKYTSPFYWGAFVMVGE